MSLKKRLSIVDKAVITATGNSNVIVGSDTESLINTSDMITLNGTATRDYTKSGTSAKLSILEESTVLYAELLWYSTVRSTFTGAADLRGIQDQAITLTMPNGDVEFIKPEDGQNFITFTTNETVRFRSADVTKLVAKQLGGNYSVSKIPTSIPPTGLNNSRCGWSLNVVYRNNAFAPKKIDFMSGVDYSTDGQAMQTIVSGFTTPSNINNRKGAMLFTAANGAPLKETESVCIGPSFANLSVLGNNVECPSQNPETAPNNPCNNFFSGTINNCDPLSENMGLIDMSGTNGMKNNDGFSRVQKIGARNKWDMTAVDISEYLECNQSQLAVQMESDSYSVQMLAIGTQIDAIAPDITVNLEMYSAFGDDSNVEVGERVVYAITVENKGEEAANNVILKLNLGNYLSIVPNSVRINNVITTDADIANGINLGTVPSYGLTRVGFEAIVSSLPPQEAAMGLHTITNSAEYSYDFLSGVTTITNTGNSNSNTLLVHSGELSIARTASTLIPNVGSTIVYTNVITNTGSQKAKNLVFLDVDTPYSSFVANSVWIDQVQRPGLDPTAGFQLEELEEGASVNVSYSVVIDSVPPAKELSTTSQVKYYDQLLDSNNMRYQTAFSNATSLMIQYDKVIKVTSASSQYPKAGETVTYITNLTNVGNSMAANVYVQEAPVAGTEFVPGSLSVDGVNMPGENPYSGFTLATPIAPQATSTIKYEATVTSLASNDKVDNTAVIPYEYKITDEQGIVIDVKESNKVETKSNYVCLTMTETASLTCAKLGSVIYYTVDISNTGNISADDMVFSSYIQSDTTFIDGSVTINGISYPSYHPMNGFFVGTIYPGNTTTVTFGVTVTNIPDGHVAYNQSGLTYRYLPNPNAAAVMGLMAANRVETALNESTYTVTVNVDKNYALVSDPLVYTIELNNTGSTSLTEINFCDLMSTSEVFREGTVYINGVNYKDYDPRIGFPLQDLNAGETARIVFAVIVTNAPQVGFITNKAVFTLAYQTCIDMPAIITTAYSDDIRTYIVNGSVSLFKDTSVIYASVDDKVSYTVSVVNNGNVPLRDVSIIDAVPDALQFITGSVYVNNINQPSYNPVNGILIGILNVGQSVKISFDATVVSVPTPNLVNNYATGIYTYTIDPSQQPMTESKVSNTVTTFVNMSDVTLTKEVDRAYGAVGDILTYTITILNGGTVPLSSIILTDVLVPEAELQPGGVDINGVSQPTYDPNYGFEVPDILAGGNAVIVFHAKIVDVPNDKVIANTATISYAYTLVPEQGFVSETRTSNTVTTNVNMVSVSNVKTVDKAYATANEVLTYTSVITNNSTVPLVNTKFIDVFSDQVTFVAGSVVIDGVKHPTYDPQNAFTLGTIGIGETVEVKFKAMVVERPSVEEVSNQSNINYGCQLYPDYPYITYQDAWSNLVTTAVKIGTLTVQKEADRIEARLNDLINYQISIANTGNTVLQNLYVKDILQSESTFVVDSVSIDGEQKAGYDPAQGFSLPDLPVGGYLVVGFQVTVNALPPADQIIYNQCNVAYSYYVDPSSSPHSESVDSGTTRVLVQDMLISSTKTVDKAIEKMGNTLTYTIEVKNGGNVTAKDVFFTDALVSELDFVDQSVVINGVSYTSYDPNQGFSLGNIAAGKTSTVQFDALIIGRPADNTIYNRATQTYTYTMAGTTYDGTMTTNTVSTLVAFGELTHNKYHDKTYGSMGDNITYTAIIQNTGSVDATDLVFKDVIQSDALFTTGSVSIDGVSYPNYHPSSGFSLDDLAPNAWHVITFSVKINDMPESGRIDNASEISFTYQLSKYDAPVTKTTTSNEVTTYVQLGKLVAEKSADMSYATIGDVITYTVAITNTGNVACSKVIFKDPIQNEAAFVEQSVMINGEPYPTYHPIDRFELPEIAPGEMVNVVFKAKVGMLPTSLFLSNTAEVNYQYYVYQSSEPISSTISSNTVQTAINVSTLMVEKAADKEYATIGDAITYTVSITNTGTVDAFAINFRDVVMAGLTFEIGSVTIDGTSYPDYDPYDSFPIPKLSQGQSSKVAFRASVTYLPVPNAVSNVANVIYSYQIDPNGTVTTVEQLSNTVVTTINTSSLTVEKTVDKAYALAEEELVYSFVLKNTGNVTLTNVMFYDNLEQNITFAIGSVSVDGSRKQNYDPTVGFLIGTMDPLAQVTVSFTANIISQPVNSSVLNFGYATFDYQINPSGETYTNTSQSNTVATTLILPSIQGTKAVDLAYATINDTLNYTVMVKNTGNHLLSKVYFVDTLSNGGSFISGSVTIDGTEYPTYNPIDGFMLPDLPVGITAVVQFKTTVVMLPSPPAITNYAISAAKCMIMQTGKTVDVSAKSNEVSTNIMVGSLSNVKTVDKEYARVADIITFTDVITNTGNVPASSVYFTDQLQKEASFVTGSVMIDSVRYPDLDPTVGFALADMAAGAVTTISFAAAINDMPMPPIIHNCSQAAFQYKIDPSGISYTQTASSGATATNVVNGELTASKKVDKAVATVGDELAYTVTLTNTGNVSTNDIVFTDVPGEGAEFKQGSVSVNGVLQPMYDPAAGFALPCIMAGSVVTVCFIATVTSVPAANAVNNTATVAFTYLVDPKQQPYSGTTTTNTATTQVALGNLSVTKVVDKEYATIGDTLTYAIAIKNVGNIEASNVKFTDPAPANTTFSIGSVTINGENYPNYNPEIGFMLGTILPGQTVMVTYQVVISNGCTS